APRGLPRLSQRETQRAREKESAQGEHSEQIKHPGGDERSREHGHGQESRAGQDRLPGGGSPVAVEDRQHREARPLVVLAEHPADREEVRQLPEKEQREK